MGTRWPDYHWVQVPTIATDAFDRSHNCALDSRTSIVSLIMLTYEDFDRACQRGIESITPVSSILYTFLAKLAESCSTSFITSNQCTTFPYLFFSCTVSCSKYVWNLHEIVATKLNNNSYYSIVSMQLRQTLPYLLEIRKVVWWRYSEKTLLCDARRHPANWQLGRSHYLFSFVERS
jgi:hypothetical protein